MCTILVAASALSACGGGGGGGVSAPSPAPVIVAPAITEQPRAQTAAPGAPVTFAVTASGTAPLAYQWLRNGLPIDGATGAIYTIPAVQPSDSSAVIRVRVSNTSGKADSSPALLSVGGNGLRTFVGLVGDVSEPGDSALNSPASVVVNTHGKLYTADGNQVLTVNGAGEVATFGAYPPCKLRGGAADMAGNLYYACTNAILKVAPSGASTVIAGDPEQAGYRDGAQALFDAPAGVAVGAAGAVYVADSGNRRVRRGGPDGVVSTVAGNVEQPGSVDGTGAAASFSVLGDIAIDRQGVLLVSDDNAIRKVTVSGAVTTIAGALSDLAGNGATRDWADGAGAAARFNQPRGLAVDAAGNVLVADGGNDAIRSIMPAGEVTTLAGNRGPGSADGLASLASFMTRRSVAVDPSGNVYVAEFYNRTVRRFYPLIIRRCV